MNVKKQKFLILGVSKSGFAAAKYVLKQGGKCYIYEELSGEKIDASVGELILCGAVRVNAENVDSVILQCDAVIISPGVPINHEIAVKAKKVGKRIIGELEFAFLQYNPLCVAITGTNGKTTTLNMLGGILQSAGMNCKLVGNIGVPVSEVIEETEKNDVLLTEVSSFQLESVHAFCPHISCILNISPDHLERHYSMENYVYLKKRIFANQTKTEYAILNYDDETVRSFASEIKAQIVWVSLAEKVPGAYCFNGGLYYDDRLIAYEHELPFKGEHNKINALFAAACAGLLGLSDEEIKKGLTEFKGVRHRIELVLEKRGVKFYDDSKATNTASAMTAIESMTEPTVLILGGSEKGENYEELFNKIKESVVKHTVITGASRLHMLEAAGNTGCADITVTENFDSAIKIAGILADSGDCVLLSPACASFDSFKNYEERGDEFKRIAESLS